jgi:uncharacterized membrane protein
MRLWLAILAVTMANWMLKAAGPVALGKRNLPKRARGVISLMAPVLLAGLIVVELAGPGWAGITRTQVAGVAIAGAARALRAPMLVAVLIGAIATAALRAL